MEKLLKRPRLVIGIVAAITVFLGLQILRVELDNNNMRFLPDGNSAKIIANYIDETFGGQVIILVGLQRPYKTVFENDFLRRIKEFSRDVQAVEFVKDVNSIMSTQYITGDSESIIVTDLVPEDFSGTDAEISELRRRIGSWDLFRGALVSDDLSATQIIITLDVMTEDSTRPEVTRSLNTIRELAREKFSGLAEVYVTGQPVINTTINESIINDNLLLIPLVAVVLLCVLFLSFRSFVFVALPLSTVCIAVVWTAGMAALLGIKLSIITTILPVILLAVGSAYGIHVVTHYMKDTAPGPDGGIALTAEGHRALVFALMRKLLKPVFLAALTTTAGFASFCFTPIVPIREFGYCASAGVIAAFSVAVTFIPSVLLVRGPRALKPRNKKQAGEDRFSGAVAAFFLGIAGKKSAVIAITVLAVCVSIYGSSKVIVDNVFVDYFHNETDISRSDRFIREYFGGSKELNLVIEADTPEELLHPGLLRAVDNLSVFLTERVPEVGKVAGFTDIIKRINQVFNVGEPPEGLQPGIQPAGYPDAAPGSAPAETGGFGFGSDDDSEFGGFGFGDFGFGGGFETEAPEKENYREEGPAGHDLSQYSAADLIMFLDTASGVSPYLSGSDLVSELKRLTNYEGMAYYEIPSDPGRYGKNTEEELQRLISNYLILLAGDDNSGYSNDPLEPTAIRTMVQLRSTGNKDTQAVIERINSYIALNFPENVRVMIGGGAAIEGAVTDLIVNSSVISIALSVLMVLVIVAASNKSLVAGIIGSAPLALAILCNFAVMGFTGIKLNMGTALLGSLTVGIGIDYTIHFIEFFKLEYRADKKDFLFRTYIGCGKAIIINALSVGAGFGVLAFSRFKIIAELGLLVALCMMTTAFISLTVIPVLLTLIKPKFIYGGTANEGKQ
ncbi:MAG: MMPL family transporter [Treponema sp.]|nr:MMPL family transporter [Treponema sp.]